MVRSFELLKRTANPVSFCVARMFFRNLKSTTAAEFRQEPRLTLTSPAHAPPYLQIRKPELSAQSNSLEASSLRPG